MAQLVEQLIRNQQVAGSNPASSSKNPSGQIHLSARVFSLFCQSLERHVRALARKRQALPGAPLGGMAVSGIEKYFKGRLFQATVRQRNMDEIARFARTISIPSLSLLTNPASSSKKPEWADTSVRSGFLVYLPVARKACSSFGAQAASPRQYAALIVALFNIMCPERAVCFLGSELARRASPRPTNSWRDSAP